MNTWPQAVAEQMSPFNTANSKHQGLVAMDLMQSMLPFVETAKPPYATCKGLQALRD